MFNIISKQASMTLGRKTSYQINQINTQFIVNQRIKQIKLIIICVICETVWVTWRDLREIRNFAAKTPLKKCIHLLENCKIIPTFVRFKK